LIFVCVLTEVVVKLAIVVTVRSLKIKRELLIKEGKKMKKKTEIIVDLTECDLDGAKTWFGALKSSVAYFRIDWEFVILSMLDPIIGSLAGQEDQPARDGHHFFEMARGRIFLDVDFYTATKRFSLLLEAIQKWGVKMVSVSGHSSFEVMRCVASSVRDGGIVLADMSLSTLDMVGIAKHAGCQGITCSKAFLKRLNEQNMYHSMIRVVYDISLPKARELQADYVVLQPQEAEKIILTEALL